MATTQPSSNQNQKKSNRAPVPQSQDTDPVCGMRLDDPDPAFAVERDGQEYQFCSAACRDQFQSNPRKYA